MRKLQTRLLAGGAVAVFAGATAFALTSTAGPTATANTTALTTAAKTGTALSVTAATANTTALTTAAKTGTALSVTAAKATITAGRRDVIGGKLTKAGAAPVGRRVVELYRYDAKQNKWVPVRAKLTRKAGAARFVVRPLVTAEYELVYHGNATLAASHSAPVTITVTR